MALGYDGYRNVCLNFFQLSVEAPTKHLDVYEIDITGLEGRNVVGVLNSIINGDNYRNTSMFQFSSCVQTPIRINQVMEWCIIRIEIPRRRSNTPINASTIYWKNITGKILIFSLRI